MRPGRHVRARIGATLASACLLAGTAAGPASASPRPVDRSTGCVDGLLPSNLVVRTSSDGATVTVRPRRPLCRPVNLLWAAYTVPSSWDGKGVDRSAVPQYMVSQAAALLSGSQTVTMQVQLPCGNVQVDLYYPPAMMTVGPPAHGRPPVQVRLWHRGGCSAPDQRTDFTTPPGVLTLSTPYPPGSALNLGSLSLDQSGTELSASVLFDSIQVSDSRAGGLPWTLTVQALPLVAAGGAQINPQNLGLVDVGADPVPGNALPGPLGNVAVYDAPPAQPAVGPGADGTQGLGGPQLLAHATVGTGTIKFHGTLVLVAPTATPAGNYVGTIVLTVS